MSKSGFTIEWEAEDGYIGGSRPQQTKFETYAIEGQMDDADLEDLFWEVLQEDFAQKVTPSPSNFDEFMEWARGVRDEAASEAARDQS